MDDVGTVVNLRRAKDSESIHIFGNTGSLSTWNFGDVNDLLSLRNTWYLMDSLDPQPGELKAVTIRVSPPSRHYYNQFIKYSMTDSLRYLPVWSLEELQECAALYQMTPTAIEEEYSLIGGIPRFVLEKGSSNFFQNGMVNGEIGRLIHDNFKLLAPEYEISELVVHDIVNSDFQKTGIQFASTFVTNKALETLSRREQGELYEYLSTHSCIPEGFRTNLLEAYTRRALSRGGRGKSKRFQDGPRAD